MLTYMTYVHMLYVLLCTRHVYTEAARLSPGPVRAVDPDPALLSAWSAVVRRRHRPGYLARAQSRARVRGQNSRGKTAHHRHQVERCLLSPW